MKTQKMILFSLLIAGSALTMNGCKKEKIKGCMDKNSVTYNANAEEDNGSCTYEGSCVFWVMAGDIDPSAGESINVYVDGVFQGNIAVSFSSTPICDNAGALTIHKDLGTNKTKGYSVVCKAVYSGDEDTDPADWLTTTLNFTGNTCINYRIE